MNLPQLTVTRFVAALGVVVLHLGRKVWPFALAPEFMSLLNLAVSYFFTLSGFILVIAQVRNGTLPDRVAAKTFYRNRFARLYPLYFLALAMAVVFNLFSSHPFEDMKAVEVMANLFLAQSWIPDFALSINYPGWSLSVEVLFYALFPWMFERMRRWLPATGLWAMALMLAICLAATFASYQQHLQHEFVAHFPLLHLGSFLFGMATGYAFVRYRTQWMPYRWAFRLAGSAALIGITFPLRHSAILATLAHNGFLVPMYLLCIVGIALSTRERPLLSRGPLPWLGEISYGIYILHIPLAMYSYGPAAWLSRKVGIDPLWIQLLILMAVAGAAYQWLEIPARKLIRGKRTPPPIVEVAAERSIGIVD